ncbi:MAG: hypothetical protein AAF514_14455, partial [Verrucomicrobiota bacterium]
RIRNGRNMRLTAEVTGKLDSRRSCDALLYAPLGQSLTFLRSRLYSLSGNGPNERAEGFVSEVLFDPISQNLSLTGDPVHGDAFFILDYGIKPGALDLEKEAILRYYQGLDDPGFLLEDLQLRQRLYVFGDSNEAERAREIFVRDIVNPAIHVWNFSHV